MKKNLKESIKAKVKAKAEATKEKLKGAKKCAVALLSLASLLSLCGGCMDTNPASRQNSNAFGDIEPAVKVVIGEGAVSNTVAVTVTTTLGDGVLASADSAGSTDTQTVTPTQTTDVKPKIDARYNDPAVGTASAAAEAVK